MPSTHCRRPGHRTDAAPATRDAAGMPSRAAAVALVDWVLPGDRPPPLRAPARTRWKAPLRLLASLAGGWVLLWALLIAFPLVITNPAWTTIGIFAVMFMVAVVGWNILSGYSGYISIGHASFYGIGQYTIALLAMHLKLPGGWDLFALLPVAGLFAAIAARREISRT